MNCSHRRTSTSIVGHHVHVIQPIDRVGEKYVLYGVGNFLSNQSPVADATLPAASQDGVIVDVTFTESDVNGVFKTTKVGYTPTWVDRSGYIITPVAAAPERCGDARRDEDRSATIVAADDCGDQRQWRHGERRRRDRRAMTLGRVRSMRSRLGAAVTSLDVVTGSAVALTLAKIIGAALNPPHFRPLTPHDDALYVRRAVQMMQGHWVGVLDQYTFMRGPLYPLYLAFVGRSGLPLSIVEQLLICGASFWVAVEIGRFVGNGKRTIAGAYILVLMFPFQETWSGSHMIRDNLFHVALLVVIALGFVAWRDPRVRSLLWFCLALGAMAIMREDALWLAPAAVVVIYLHTRRVLARERYAACRPTASSRVPGDGRAAGARGQPQRALRTAGAHAVRRQAIRARASGAGPLCQRRQLVAVHVHRRAAGSRRGVEPRVRACRTGNGRAGGTRRVFSRSTTSVSASPTRSTTPG